MRPGERLGPYVLRREIGEGGIASVWVAEHETFKVDVVLKVFREELLGQQETLAIFLAEPRALQAVEHENALEVTDEVSQGQHHYFATELLRGRTLADLMRNGRLPLPRAVHIARQVATVLAHAHDVDVVHRNLKPANVFVMKQDEDPSFVKLLELGAVRMEIRGEKPVPGTVIGTPAYMAPEQLRQMAGDQRVDMYSFGVLLFELAVGRKPFVGDVNDIVRKHILEPAPRARSLAPDVPEALDSLIARCLEKDPDARPPSMHEVALALAALADTLGKPAAVDDGPPPSLAVPKNTSGYTTVAADVTVAPPAILVSEEDEPSFPTVTDERPASNPDADALEDPTVLDVHRDGARDTAPEKPAPPAAPAPAPAPAPTPTVAAEIDPGLRPKAPAKSPLVPVLAAAGAIVVVLLIVVALASGDDETAVADAGAATPVDVDPPNDPEPVKDPEPAKDPEPLKDPQPVKKDPQPTPTTTAPTQKDSVVVGFSSTPPDAQVWIRLDGKIRMLCNTPCDFTLPGGKEVLVELRKDGHKSAQKTFTVVEGARFDGILKPR